MVLLLVLIGIILLALVFRFVQPELIYSFRQVVMDVRANKAFLDYEVGRGDANELFKEQLMNDLRQETHEHNEDYALERALKIRELYRVMDLRRASTPEQAKALKPQVCIIELANLLGNLGREVIPRIEYNHSLVKGQGLLAYIGNEIRRTKDEEPLASEKEIEEYFTENPISVEQAIELLTAAVSGLAYRQRAQRASGLEAKRAQPVDCWVAIRNLERRLRLVVDSGLKEKYQFEEAVYDRIREVLGRESFDQCLRRMEKTRKGSKDVVLSFLDFLYLSQLERVIFADWDYFGKAFPERSWLEERMEKIRQVRNEVAHSRPVSRPDQNVVRDHCREIETRIGEFDPSGQWSRRDWATRRPF